MLLLAEKNKNSTMADAKEGYGKSYKKNLKKYLLLYIVIGAIAYFLIWYLFLRGAYAG